MAEVAYTPPYMPEPTRYFALIVIGFALIIIGAVLINYGIGMMSSSTNILAGVSLFVCGVLLIFAGASKLWKTKPQNNFAMIAIGIAFLAAGIALMFGEWQPALFAMLLTVIGIAMVFGGAAVVMRNWKNYIKQ
ncbi:MAG: hypothetical protein QW567_01560 [Candidatus Hadarchaeales archaeon]